MHCAAPQEGLLHGPPRAHRSETSISKKSDRCAVRSAGDDEPASVITELVIDSSGGHRRVQRDKNGGSSSGGGGSGDSSGSGQRQSLRGGSDGLALQRDSQAAASSQAGGEFDATAVQKTAAQLYAEKQAAALARALPRDFDWQVIAHLHTCLHSSTSGARNNEQQGLVAHCRSLHAGSALALQLSGVTNCMSLPSKVHLDPEH